VTVPRVLEPSRTGAADFQALYLRYYPTVFALASWRTRDALLAEETTAQTFLQALQAWHRTCVHLFGMVFGGLHLWRGRRKSYAHMLSLCFYPGQPAPEETVAV
jgi:hypothetical protein